MSRGCLHSTGLHALPGGVACRARYPPSPHRVDRATITREAYLDITENKTSWPRPPRLPAQFQQIREELNLTASAGVAPNKFLAKVASDWRNQTGYL